LTDPHEDQEDGRMRKLFSFMVVSLDGYYEGPDGEFDWPNVDHEFNEFSIAQNATVGMLVFGRVTYEGMAGYWTQAPESDPVTGFMNNVPKVVCSSSLEAADWNNSALVRTDAAEAIRKLKEEDGKDLAVYGSPTLTASLLEQGVVDELRVMVHPILLGGGRSLFATLSRRVPVSLVRTSTFSSGNVLLVYRPCADRAGGADRTPGTTGSGSRSREPGVDAGQGSVPGLDRCAGGLDGRTRGRRE
jgi:dihydrofolate reductase